MEKDIINNYTSKIGIKNKPKVFFTADLHLSHRNLVKSLTTWEDKAPCRNFISVEEMNDTIINNINSVVDEDDILYILGDFAICHLREWENLRKRIKCKNIHLILGNHDPKKELLKTDKPLFTGTTITPKDLFKSIKHVDEITIKLSDDSEQRISLSHYSHRTWNRGHHGAWCLYGHSHGSLEQYFNKPMWYIRLCKMMRLDVTKYMYKTIDVGIDTNNFMPYSADDLQIMFKNRTNIGVDHHRADNKNS